MLIYDHYYLTENLMDELRLFHFVLIDSYRGQLNLARLSTLIFYP